MDSEILVLTSAVLGLVIILLSFLYFQKKAASAPEEEVPTEVAAPARRRRRGMQDVDDDDVDQDPAATDNADYEFAGMSEKQIKKAMRKKEKQEQRAALEASRQAADEAKDKKKMAYQEKQAAKEEERQRLAAEALEKAREKQKKSEEEYDKWKDMISVEEEGTNVAAQEAESADMLAEFIQEIMGKKVVMIEDLAGAFDLRTQEAMNRLEALERMGRISGVFDDRGKFIYITREELNAVAAYIQDKGRISISELAKASNKLIDLNPVQAE